MNREAFKGTQGLWRAGKPFKLDNNVCIDIVSEDKQCKACNKKELGLLIARTFKHALPKEEQAYNAKLIAAAPELLNAVTEAQDVFEMLINIAPTGELRNKLCDANIQFLTLINKIR